VRQQIQEFLLNGPATASKIIKACDAAKVTTYKYLDELCDEGGVIWKPQRKRGKNTYELSDEARDETEKRKKEHEIHSLISSLDAKWLRPLRNLLIRVKHEETDLEGFLNTNCITFVGDVPCTFHKSVEGTQSHIAFEENLRKRHLSALERLKDEFIKEGEFNRENWKKIDACVTEEVGWSVGEYFRKLLRKAEKQKGFIRKFMTVYGITEEMLVEMYRKQGWYKEKS